ncbi:MAG: ATP-binding cassette domain-containing protein [Leadbetterella sp.]|nr:ATP-binding cassette domain-containing protein [Leadbetterella sp.]
MKQLHVDSVVKHFFTTKVLSDVYLSCSPGEITGIFGRNGSGKSTLLKIIFGSMPADHAYVKIDGKVYTRRSERPSRIAYLYQDSFIPDHLEVKTVLNLMGLHHLKDHPAVKSILRSTFASISGGEARYLEILFILNRPAPYILLDEPFNGLSPILKDEVKELIRSAAEKGKGIILTDHDYRNVLDIATHKYSMRDGVLKPFKDPEELRLLGYLP